MMSSGKVVRAGDILVYDIVGVAISYPLDNVYQKVQSDYTIYNINLSGLVNRIKLVSRHSYYGYSNIAKCCYPQLGIVLFELTSTRSVSIFGFLEVLLSCDDLFDIFACVLRRCSVSKR